MDINTEKLIIEHNHKYQMLKIAELILTILFIAILIFILWKLSKALARGVKEHNAGKVAVCMTITIILFWPVAIGQGIYLLLEWQRKPQEKGNRDEPPKEQKNQKPFTQADFERWKQDKGGFVDLDAPIVLPWRRTA